MDSYLKDISVEGNETFKMEVPSVTFKRPLPPKARRGSATLQITLLR